MPLPASWTAAWKEHRALVLIGLAAVLAGTALLITSWRGPAVPAYTVARGDVLQTVVASGRVVNPRRVDLGSQITASVARVPVQEGQHVRAGDILIELEGDELRAQVAQSRAALTQAQGRLRQLGATTLPTAEQSLRQAEANLVNVQHQYDRTRELHGTGFVGPAQLDDARRNLEVARSQLRAAQLQVEDNRPQGNAERLAHLAVDQASAALQMA
ncbi:HlyD family secretion protein [Ideonella sp. YS5]|uniref:HlyD family secretion protein n=1 Tax=Ideonella sp. YS5 TaxID=3453714 RepID=UPI003EEC1838